MEFLRMTGWEHATGVLVGGKLEFHVDFRPQIYRVRIFCGG
jgi:hypothetical protein